MGTVGQQQPDRRSEYRKHWKSKFGSAADCFRFVYCGDLIISVLWGVQLPVATNPRKKQF